MNKTSHKTKAYDFTITARTEAGRCEVSIGLDELSTGERQFLFDTLRRTQQGGQAIMGLHESGPGEKTLSVLLKEPIPVDLSVRAAINGTH